MGRPKTREDYVRRLRRLYDNFAVKDLTWEQFRNEMLEL